MSMKTCILKCSFSLSEFVITNNQSYAELPPPPAPPPTDDSLQLLAEVLSRGRTDTERKVAGDSPTLQRRGEQFSPQRRGPTHCSSQGKCDTKFNNCPQPETEQRTIHLWTILLHQLDPKKTCINIIVVLHINPLELRKNQLSPVCELELSHSRGSAFSSRGSISSPLYHLGFNLYKYSCNFEWFVCHLQMKI